MCGIAGFWQSDGLMDGAQSVIQRMTDAIRHRGPDGEGHWLDAESGVVLGHRRLSILDLSPAGAQPMVSPSGRYVVTFNGEFYNWRELRAEEDRHGVSWRGHSDTEVFLAMCDRLGVVTAVERSAGMFAMAVWDRQERTLTLVRDRVGEKPLYYGWCNGVLLFGSELKALKQHPAWHGAIDRGALTLYFRHSYIPGPYSIFENVRKLPPGTLVTFRPGAERWPAPMPYWSARAVAEQGTSTLMQGGPDAVADEVEQVLLRVIGQEMVADVPLGAFLSGGIDSSLIVALMQAQSSRPVKTFTVGFHEAAFNEADHAKAVAAHLGTEHTEHYLSAHDALDVIPSIATMFDEPFADSSQLPTFLVAQMARQHVTVSLSGDGGDEAFGGYNRYLFASRSWPRLRRLPAPMRGLLSKVLDLLPPERWDGVIERFGLGRLGLNGDRVHTVADILRRPLTQSNYYRYLVSQWKEPTTLVRGGSEPATILGEASLDHASDFVGAMMVADQLTYLPDDILCKVDRTAMAVSLESRAPFLHHEVLAVAARIPAAQRIVDGAGKAVLRRLLARRMPRALFERPKRGFAIPLAEWLRGPLRGEMEPLTRLEGTALGEYLEPAVVRRVVQEHLSGGRNRQYALWPVMIFDRWLAAQEGRA
ncbi:MAG: asparagine synthase (glutamine-hydrolyzing) [Gemmatimonadales bacterium]